MLRVKNMVNTRFNKYNPSIIYEAVDDSNYFLNNYLPIATVNGREDLKKKALEAFVDERPPPEIIRITDVNELRVGEKTVHYALAISFLSK